MGFGNTAPAADDEVLGRRQRGVSTDRTFCATTGAGYVAEMPGDYARARANGCDVRTLLFETFGGFGAGVVELLREAAEARGNKLRGSEYDATTWPARTWTSFAVQRVMRQVAWELASAMELTTVRDGPDGATERVGSERLRTRVVRE